MKKVKLLFAASVLATISFFAINMNDSVAAKGDKCLGSTKITDGKYKCTRYGSDCPRNCGFLEFDWL